MSTFRFALGLLGTIVYIRMFPELYFVFFSYVDPVAYGFRFNVAQSSFNEFNFTETTRIDGTNNLHYRYNLSLNITVRVPDDKNYDFMHFDDVRVMASYKNKTFAMVDLSSIYSGKDLTNTTDLLSLTHSLIGEYVDVLVIDHPPVVYGTGRNISDGHGGSAAAITDDYMVAQLHYSVSPPRNSTWPYKTIYSKEELEFKCKLELKFPLINGYFSQHTNIASTPKTIRCVPNVVVYSQKPYLYFVAVFPGFLFISFSAAAFLWWLFSTSVSPDYI